MNLPKKITPCPIVDSLVEIRFATHFPPDAIFGVLYNEFKDKYPNVEKLPILQLPDAVRMSDPNLKYKPLYKIINNDFIIQIGVDVISISSFPKYCGWKLFESEIDTCLKIIKQTNVISNIHRIALRYINFFDSDIFNNTNIKISIGENNDISPNTFFKTEVTKNNVVSNLQISNSANVNNKIGSIIDIDSIYISPIQDFYNESISIFQDLHNNEKELFYSLLKPEYLDKFNPEY